MVSGHDDVSLFEWRWFNTEIENYFIIASLMRETIIGKLINRIPGSK